MRIYDNAREMMSEMGRNLYEMGVIVRPRHYQNKFIGGNDNFVTTELEGEQYTLLSLTDPDELFKFTNSKEWAREEFNERLDWVNKPNPGRAYHLRPQVWYEMLNEKGKFDYTYSERINKDVRYKDLNLHAIESIIELLSEDPYTRKAILSIWGDEDASRLDGSRRIPCSMYYDFLIRPVPGLKDAQGKDQLRLNLHYHQRSSDFITHFGNDVYLAWRMMEYVASMLNVKVGYLVHSIDSLHIYHKDMDKLKATI